eukprot:82296_1
MLYQLLIVAYTLVAFTSANDDKAISMQRLLLGSDESKDSGHTGGKAGDKRYGWDKSTDNDKYDKSKSNDKGSGWDKSKSNDKGEINIVVIMVMVVIKVILIDMIMTDMIIKNGVNMIKIHIFREMEV